MGRGGAANFIRLNSEEAEVSKTNHNGPAAAGAEDHGSAVPHHHKTHSNGHNGLAAKAKEFFKKA